MEKIKSGVYAIVCNPTGKMYIGSSVNIPSRKSRHFRSLIENQHFCAHLQNAWNKHGKDTFDFKIIEQSLAPDVVTIEQKWLDYYWDTGCLFNTRRVAHSNYGIKTSQTTKHLISIFQKKRASTDEGKKQIQSSLALAQISNHTLEANVKRSQSLKKWAKSDQGQKHYKKIFESSKQPKAIQKLSESLKKWSTTNIGRTSIRKANAAAAKRLRVLTEKQVDDITLQLSNGKCRAVLAKEFNVSKETIRRIAIHKYCLFGETNENL